MKNPWFCLILVTACTVSATAQQQPGNPLQSLLVAPDVLIRHRGEIGLSDEQVRRIQVLLEEAGPEMQRLQERANDSMGRLAELLSKEEVDGDATAKQFEQFLAIEKEQRLYQLRTMLQIRTELTSAQRQMAAKFGESRNPDEGREQRLQAKITRIETEVQSRAVAGTPALEAIGLMQGVPVLMQNGQVREAELLLDRVIGTLGLDTADKLQPRGVSIPPQIAAKIEQLHQRARQMEQSGRDVSQLRMILQQLAALIQQGRGDEAVKLVEQAQHLTGLASVERAWPPEHERSASQTRPIDSTLTADGLDDTQAQDEFYRADEVQTIQLRIASEDLRRLVAALPERIYVPATFQWRDMKVDNVAVRFKGNSSANPSQSHKRSLLIKFDEYDKDIRFFGLRRVSFDNGVQFGSLFSEPIITEILRDQGVPTHRANYARIFVNGDYQGVYVNVERIDETFIQRNLPDPNGALYKADVGGPGSDLQFLGDDPSIYEKGLEAESGSAKKGRAQLVDFIRTINQTNPSECAATLASSMELDDFLRVSAVMLFSGAFDQLTGGSPHNYYLYHDAKSDRWRYLPWDLDVGFSETAFGQIRVLADWNAAWPLAPNGGPNPLVERVVADPVVLEQYRQVAREILDKYYEPERLGRIFDAKYELIKQDLEADPYPHRRITGPGDQGYGGIVESMKEFVRKRHDTALQQLENPGARPEVVRTPRGPDGRRPPMLPPQLAGQVQRIEQHVRELQQNGQGDSPVLKLLPKLGAMLQQGRFEEAERIVAEVLKLVDEDSSEPPKKLLPDQ